MTTKTQKVVLIETPNGAFIENTQTGQAPTGVWWLENNFVIKSSDYVEYVPDVFYLTHPDCPALETYEIIELDIRNSFDNKLIASCKRNKPQYQEFKEFFLKLDSVSLEVKDKKNV